MQPLWLFDGTLLFFRALYGLPDVFVDTTGRSINGVRGYLQYLRATLSRNDVRYAVVAFDESLNTCWRNDVYPQYKANRPPADDNIRFQIKRCRSLTEAVGIRVLADKRYEADDIIATLASRAKRDVVIVSRDKDLQQLLSSRVRLLAPGSDDFVGPQQFEEKEGFGPGMFPDYQALAGDSVDNVPGVKGVGDKTARRLVTTFGTLENIYDHRSRWLEAGIKESSKVAANLHEERDRAFLFRRILRLATNAELRYPRDITRVGRPKESEIRMQLKRLGLLESLGNVLIDRGGM